MFWRFEGEGAQPPNLDLKQEHLMTQALHPLVTEGRDTGPGHYVITRSYPSGDADACAIRLDAGEQLRRGGGAGRKATARDDMCPVVLKKSVQRARSVVRRKAMSMNADRLLTCTFRQNVVDVDECWSIWRKFSRLMKRRYALRTNGRDEEGRPVPAPWTYVVVMERQQRGAIHFHAIVQGFYHANTVRRLWRQAIGEYEGNIDFTSPKKFGKATWNPRRCAQYLSKYITKSAIADFNRKRYASGGKIEIPEPRRGWLALGVPVQLVLSQIIDSLSRKNLATAFETDEGFFPIVYLST